MWEVKNYTRYNVNRCWVRDMNGREVWLIAVRARFRISSEVEAYWDPELPQDEVRIAPEFSGKGGAALLVADTDLVHVKPNTDVLLAGHAHALRGHPVTRCVVRMRIGPIDKTVIVFGDRDWTSMGVSTPRPFTSMPLMYTRAFGGPDVAGTCDSPAWFEMNPVGVSFSSRPQALNGRPLPNIEDPTALISSRSDRPAPAGLGPIASHWPQRRRFAGTYDAAWERQRLPLLPLDFDTRFNQQAPADQQANGFLIGGEAVLLDGVHPDGALRFFLPRISLGFETRFDDLTRVTHRAHIHTIVFEPDMLAVSVVWHTSVECHSRVNILRETRVWERSRLRALAS